MAGAIDLTQDRRVILLLGSLFLLYLLGLALYRLFFHPLARFPGPRLAATTRYYELYYDVLKGGMYIWKVKEMHQQYGKRILPMALSTSSAKPLLVWSPLTRALGQGPIVRISPYELHIDDPDFYPTLYRQDGRWDKYPWFYKAFGLLHSVLGTLDHDQHRIRRAALNPFFSKQKISALEPVIQAQADKLVKRIEGFAASGAVLPIGTAFSAFTMDVVSEYAMEKSYGNLDREDFNQDMVDSAQGVGRVWHLGKLVTWFPPMFAVIPSWMIKMLSPKASHWKAIQEDTLVQIRKIRSLSQEGLFQEKAHKTVFHELLTSNVLPASDKSDTILQQQAVNIVSAGTETTAHALRVITYHICNDPAVLRRLREELKTVQPEPDRCMKLRELERLPFLSAVIMEGLRLSYGAVARLPRIAPDRTIEFGDWKIPAGTPVGMSALLMHHREDIYPNSTAFLPERWVDPVERKRLERYFVPFSKGTRNCVGQK
ncbi:MAG: hypothetical protein Q9187_000072 [Circinaria calcarea]